METRLKISMVVLFAAVGAGAGCGSSTSSANPDSGTSALTCAAYCTAIQANCVDPNIQYSTKDNCMNSCMAMPVGTAADTSGNTLGCRIYHAGAAKADPVTHCVHAGPGGAGVCGANCDGYCQIAMKFCTGASKVYDTLADCQTVCATAQTDAKFTVLPEPEGPQVACLLYHVQEGSTVALDHCIDDLAKDPAGPSVTCK
jgi:hypothetical protein